MGDARSFRWVWHSHDGGLTWNRTDAREGSIVYHAPIPPGGEWDDGYGNLYRNEHPDDAELVRFLDDGQGRG